MCTINKGYCERLGSQYVF